MVRLSEPSGGTPAYAQRRKMERLFPCAARIIPGMEDFGKD